MGKLSKNHIMSNNITDQITTGFKTRQVFADVMVTPTMAKRLLELNTDNRPINERTVKRYTDDMKNGNWKFTGDTISISKTGKMLNGQHRLTAIMQSNTSQKFNLQTGLEDDVFDVIDTGKNRSAADTLAIAGHKNPGILQGAIKLVISYYRMVTKKASHRSNKPTNQEVLAWLSESRADLMHECVSKAGSYYTKVRFFSPATYAAFMYLFSTKNKEQADQFFEKLVGGLDMQADDPVYVLRQKLTNLMAKSSGGAQAGATSDFKYALLVKAWNLFRDGERTRRLNWSRDEDFPRIK